MVVGYTIDERPASVSNREEFEHWELDTVVPGRGKSKACEATFIERKTRFYWTISMVDRTAESMEQAIKSFVAALKKINNRPKKPLNWKNCGEVFQVEMLQSI